jgi:hypothetical protein
LRFFHGLPLSIKRPCKEGNARGYSRCQPKQLPTPVTGKSASSAPNQNNNTPNNSDNGNKYGWDQPNNPHHYSSGGNNSCFLKGTKISTPSGDRLVQDLQIGDEVQTLAGRKTIKWIGYNKFTKAESRAWQDGVMPIRVAPFAINEHSPYRDLYLSPEHCVFFNEALIPVKYLVNETSIAQGTPSEISALEYYHVELDTHEVIYAEGALVESYIGSHRDNFSNFVQYERLYGPEHRHQVTPVAPILAKS